MVCEEVFCLNIGECFNVGIVIFLIMGLVCICVCFYCDINFEKKFQFLDVNELKQLVEVVKRLRFNYVVIIFVNRDDLIDGGVIQFVKCIF